MHIFPLVPLSLRDSFRLIFFGASQFYPDERNKDIGNIYPVILHYFYSTIVFFFWSGDTEENNDLFFIAVTLLSL